VRPAALLLLLVVTASPTPAAETLAGAALGDITPPPGTPMAGYYHARGAEGTHDPLTARALVLERDGVKAALVVLDLIETTPALTAGVRELVAEQTGIPANHVMISATHSHTGPVLLAGLPGGAGPNGVNPLTRDYSAGLPAKVAAVVKEAHAARVPVKVSQAVGREEGLAFVRRFHMADGTVGWNPGKLNPKVLRPTAEADPAVPVVYFETPAGKPVATVVNFAMHLDTVGGVYHSADYPFTLRTALAAVKGDAMVTLFTLGTCGDINHINVNSKAAQKGQGEAARIGTRLAAAVLRAYERLEPLADGPLQVTREVVKLDLAPIDPAAVPEASRIVATAQAGTKPAPPFLTQVKAYQVTKVAARLGKPLDGEVQVMTLGPDLAFVSLPGEIFVDLGRAIKLGSPFKNTVAVELANGSVGYVPSRTAYPHGAYEVITSPVAMGGGEKLVDAALVQLREQFKKAKPPATEDH
jgi:neutral ceramidase